MKAKIKDTGEIVDVKFSVHPNPAVDETYWWCQEKQESYHKRELEFLDDNMVNKPIDWEQRRYEIAKDIIPFIATSTKEILWQGRGLGEEVNDITVQEYCAKHAIFYADALIAELKGGEE